jgi:zinc protease
MRPQEPSHDSPRRLSLADPRVQQPSMQRSYLVPSATTAKPGESEALDVLAHLLGSGNTSWLYRKLVLERGIAVSAGAWYRGTALDATIFGLYGSPKPGTSLPQLEQAIDAAIEEFIAAGVTAADLERSKSRMIADSIYARDSQATMARWYGTALTTGGTVEMVQTWPNRIRAVTAGDVVNAAKAWLDKRRSVTGYLIKDAKELEDRRS